MNVEIEYIKTWLQFIDFVVQDRELFNGFYVLLFKGNG